MYCHKCGNEIKEGDKFCNSCGAIIGGSINGKSLELSKIGKVVKRLLKLIFWLGLVTLGIWLIIALGPLWIIAIILLAILFVVANK